MSAEFPPGTPIASPFGRLVGIRVLQAADGEAELIVTLTPELLNSWGGAHGGASMTLLDAAMALAANTRAPEGNAVVTIEMTTAFMQPGRGELRAHARVMTRSTTMSFCEAEVRDAYGAFVAKGLGTFKYIRRLAPAARRGEETGGDAGAQAPETTRDE
jgi:uncharacterized protein (TIGR00369 family)